MKSDLSREEIKSLSSDDMGENKEKKKDRIYSLKESYMNRSFRNEFYSIQRIDLIIISLATGCIVGLISYLDKIIESNSCILTNAWYFSIILFSLSIAFNLASQITSYKSNGIEGQWAYNEMKRLNKEIDKNPIGDNLILDKYTTFFNNASITTLFIGFMISIISLGSIVY